MKAECNQVNLDDSSPEADWLLTINEAAVEIGIPTKTARYFIQVGALPVVMRNGETFVRYGSARRFVHGTGTGPDKGFLLNKQMGEGFLPYKPR